jgi:hypothetical protein
MIERDVKKAVRALLTKHAWFHWMPPSNAFGRSGIADINAVKNGLFLAIETKVGKNLPTPQQRVFLQHVHDVGGYAFMVNESRVDALAAWLDRFDALTVGYEWNGPSDPLTMALSNIPDPPRPRA